MKRFGVCLAILLCGGAAQAQDIGDGFTDTKDGGKAHTSGFVCPPRIGLFERDAVGEKESGAHASFCAYSALDGTYGTINLSLLNGPYDPKASLAPDFIEQEGIGAHRIAEAGAKVGTLTVYTRTYETSKLESQLYSILFSGAAVGNWAVETTIEFAAPRDNAAQKMFLDTVYAAALKEIAGAQPAPPVEPLPAQTP